MIRQPVTRAALLLALVATLPLAACGGGGSSSSSGGGDDGGGGMMPTPLEATFTRDEPVGDISLEPGLSDGADFDVVVMVNGPFDDFFGAAFRIPLPADIALIAGSNGDNSFIDNGPATDFSVVQEGSEVLVVATRIQGSGKNYVPGVDVAGGTSELLMTLKFRATDMTAGAMPIGMPREVRTCNDGTETCDPVPDGSLAWTGGSIVAD